MIQRSIECKDEVWKSGLVDLLHSPQKHPVRRASTGKPGASNPKRKTKRKR